MKTAIEPHRPTGSPTHSTRVGQPSLHNTAADYAARPAHRPLTKFENRGLKLGHGVWDLIFDKR